MINDLPARMNVTCSSFSAHVLPSGKIRLDIVDGQADPIDEILYLRDIAALLRKRVKAVDRLSRRKRDPLPLVRGKGRPFGFRSSINAWLVKNQSKRAPFEAVFG